MYCQTLGTKQYGFPLWGGEMGGGWVYIILFEKIKITRRTTGARGREMVKVFLQGMEHFVKKNW